MNKNVLVVAVAIVIGFFAGYFYVDLDKAASKHPRGTLNIPAQWLMMNSTVGWERMMLIFGYADNVNVCQRLVETAKEESPGRDFRCTDAN